MSVKNAVFLDGGPGQPMVLEAENLIVVWNGDGCSVAVRQSQPLGVGKVFGKTVVWHERGVTRPASEAEARADAANVLARFFFMDFLAISGAEDFAFGKRAESIMAGLKNMGVS